MPRLRAGTVAEERPHLGAPEVDVATTEADPERTGHRRLALTGVGARVVVAVPPPHLPGALPVPVRDRRDGDGEQPGQSGRHEIEHVVEPSGRCAEPRVTRRPVPDHRVEGVRRAVAQQPGQTGDRAPEQRSDHRVGGVLRDRLDCGTGQLQLAQRRRVPPAEVTEASPSSGQITVTQRTTHGGRLVPQSATAQHCPRAGRHEHRPGHRPVPGSRRGDGPEQHRPADGQRGECRTRRSVRTVEAALQRASGLPEAGHRVPPAGVAEHPVQRVPGQQPHRVRHWRCPSHPHHLRPASLDEHPVNQPNPRSRTGNENPWSEQAGQPADARHAG
ncbi:hypothetical protein ONO86_06122 [Micromonospora noduli]|nr:hypothetical protein ONO86_06122 [Micromonospora noduli]